MAEPLDHDNLAAILKREYDAADNYHGQLAELQQQAFEYYEAQPFGNEIVGRSQVVLPDVQETIDYMAQSVLRTFVSGDRTVEFEAVEEEDEEAADEATAAINYLFMRRQDGYRVLHDGCTDGLLRKIGVFKTVMETAEKVTRETVILGPEDMLPEGVEVEQATDNPDGTLTVQIKLERIEKRFVDYAVPNAEFRFSPRARHEDEADYLCHVCEKTRSDLVEMGFDSDQVYALPAYSRDLSVDPSESDKLDQFWDEESSAALERVLLCEEYARIDLDGDGIAERVKVYRVENEILTDAKTGKPSIETVEEQPFSVFCPFPRPHRLVGYSLADKVMDIQLARSFVARQLFDGMAFANMPRPIVDSNMVTDDTYNDILSPIPGSPIRVKGGASAVQPFQSGFDVGKSLSVLEWITGERESRTGITRLNQGLDADALNKTATGTALMQAQGQQAEEFIARNLAETMGRLFAKKYRLMRSEGEPFRIKVDGQYREANPANWPDDICVVVRVGLGSGSKDKRIQYRMALMQPLAEGLAQGLVSPKNAFNLIDGLVRDMGIGQGDDYWIDPDSPDAPQQPEKPDPEMVKAQADMQREDQKLQLEAAKAEANIQLQREQGAAKIEIMREEGALKLQLERERAEFEAGLARDQQAFEMQMSERQFAFEQQQSQQRMALEASNAEHKASIAAKESEARISKKRPGGELNK